MCLYRAEIGTGYTQTTEPLLKVLAPIQILLHTAHARVLHSRCRKEEAPRTAAVRAWGIHAS